MIFFTLYRTFKGLLTITIVMCCCVLTQAQTRWVRQTVNTGAHSITLDVDGNAYVVGYFAGTTTLGQELLSSTNSVNNGFIAKYDTQGNVLWARPILGAVSLNDVAVDNQGYVYVAGTFEKEISCGGTSLSSQAVRDLLLIKYDTEGSLVWAKQGGGITGGTMQGAGLAIDNTGNLYVTGSINGTMHMDGLSMNSNRGVALLLLKYNKQGKLLWTQQGKGTGLENPGAAVGVDVAGNAYVTGRISGIGSFGTITLPALNQQSQNDVLVIKCDADGNFLWVRRDGSGARAGGSDIAVDQQGNLVITGMIDTGTATFGASVFTITSIHDGFVANYDTGGTLRWVDQIKGADTDYGTSIALDAAGNAYVTGVFASLPTIWGTTTMLSRKEGKNAFVVKYSPMGKVLAAQREGACGGTFSMGIAVNSAHEIYIAGSFSGTVSFVSTLLTSQGSLFVAKLGDLSSPSTPDSFSCNSVSTAPTIPAEPTTPTAPVTPTMPTAPTPAQPIAPTLADVFVPNIITPNNDGINEYLVVKSTDTQAWALTVYNRWGRQVYVNPAYQQNWNAPGLPNGTYYYHLLHPSGLQVKGWVEVAR